MNSMYVPKAMGLIPGSWLNWLYSPQDMAHPKPNGNAIPATPTLTASLQLLTKYLKSTSKPTRNKNNTSPRFATSDRFGIDSVGNIASVKPGIRPMTDGPRRIPPMTSAMTRGCHKRDSG